MPPDIAVSGMGVISAIGQGKHAFGRALLAGETAFAVMRRPGRQAESAYLGAEIEDVTFSPPPSPQTLRGMSLSTQAAVAVLQEAWDEARLAELDGRRVGLVVGGSNFQQREQWLVQEAYRQRLAVLRPSYALSFMDTDLCGFCTAHFGIRGLAFTTGAASASGQVAIVHAAQTVASGQVDACIALGALMDLSHWECRAFRSIGAMGSDRFAHDPERACRPGDRDRDGFIFGECCAAVVIETTDSVRRRGLAPYAALRGWGLAFDANRNPDPSLEGEQAAIRGALSVAGWAPEQVDYVNLHATGSPAGDDTEARALHGCGLGGAQVNATKSLTGHGLSAAGVVEVVATLLQMRAGRLHPTRNLENPVDDRLNWVAGHARECAVDNALKLSFGFGGVNTATCWQRLDVT
jgi:malonyl-ACP decarboxylase